MSPSTRSHIFEDILKVAELFAEEHYHLLVNNAGYGVYGKFSESYGTMAGIIDPENSGGMGGAYY